MNIKAANKKIKCYTLSCPNYADVCIESCVVNGDIYFCFDCFNLYTKIFYGDIKDYEK